MSTGNPTPNPAPDLTEAPTEDGTVKNVATRSCNIPPAPATGEVFVSASQLSDAPPATALPLPISMKAVAPPTSAPAAKMPPQTQAAPKASAKVSKDRGEGFPLAEGFDTGHISIEYIFSGGYSEVDTSFKVPLVRHLWGNVKEFGLFHCELYLTASTHSR